MYIYIYLSYKINFQEIRKEEKNRIFKLFY